jgi:hypothetical protein
VAAGIDVVGGGVADDLAGGVDGAVGGLAGEFGPAVAIKIIDDELRVVGAAADVFPEVDLPEERAVELVGLEDRLVGDAALGVVLMAAGLHDDQLVFAVAVEIGGRAFEGLVARRVDHRHAEAGPGRGAGGEHHGAGLGLFNALDERADEVGGVVLKRGLCVENPGDVGDGSGVELNGAGGHVGNGSILAEVGVGFALRKRGGPVNVERDIGRVVGEQTPGEENAAVVLYDRGEAATKMLDLRNSRRGEGRERDGEQGQGGAEGPGHVHGELIGGKDLTGRPEVGCRRSKEGGGN